MKDDSGSYAVFTAQGSSASQMTAAKIMDIISRLLGCDGQAADAVSAYTQVKWKTHRRYEQYQSQNVQIFGFVCVVLVTSMYFSGMGNDSSFGMYSLTLGST